MNGLSTLDMMYFGYDVVVVATKSDKLKNSEFKKNEKIIRETLKLTDDDKLYFFSSLNKRGIENLIDNLFLEFATDVD